MPRILTQQGTEAGRPFLRQFGRNGWHQREAIKLTAWNARLGTQNAFENILQDAEFTPGNWGLPRIDVDDAAILQSILGKARHLVALVKAHRNDLAARFLGLEKG